MLARLAALGLAIPAALTRPGRAAAAAAAPWDPRYQLTLTLQLADMGPRAERPFVAMWIENGSGQEVRTLAVWLHSQTGEQYIDSVRSWYRAYLARRDSTRVDLLRTVSAPTRRPGTYTLYWDGKDNAGRPVEQGRYNVCVEGAREFGGYSMMRKAFTFGAAPFRSEIEANGTVISVAVADYGPRGGPAGAAR